VQFFLFFSYGVFKVNTDTKHGYVYCHVGAADQAYQQIKNFASMVVHDGIHEFKQVAEKHIGYGLCCLPVPSV
jgi:hypothetical protein